MCAEQFDRPSQGNLEVGTRLTMPVAHNEGNYFAGEEELARLNDNGQIAFRYAGLITAHGQPTRMNPRSISPGSSQPTDG